MVTDGFASDEDAIRLLNEVSEHAPLDRLQRLQGASSNASLCAIRHFEIVAGAKPTADSDVLRETLARVVPTVIAGLVGFDSVFRQRWNCAWHPYVLGDNALVRLLVLSGFPERGHQVRSATAILAGLGVVYRFEAALRYHCPPGTSQIRLSGWGRQGASSFAAAQATGSIFENDAYGKLVGLLGSTEPRARTGWAEEIDRANRAVPVPVVA